MSRDYCKKQVFATIKSSDLANLYIAKINSMHVKF